MRKRFGLESFILLIIGLFVFLPVLFFQGCMSEEGEDPDNSASSIPLEDQAPVTEYTGRNNSAILEGVQVGTLTADNLELSKTLKLTLRTDNKNFLIGPASVSRSENTAGLTVRFLLPIKNTSENKAFCGVKTVGLTFKVAGAGVASDAINKQAIGSVGIANSDSTASCLAPGETGYFFQKVSAAYAGFLSFYGEVDEIEIERITVKVVSVINPNLSVAPIIYSYLGALDVIDPTTDAIILDSTTDVSGAIQLTFEITNDNVDPAFIWPSRSYYILLNAEDKPLFWGVINSFTVWPTQLLSGESTVLESTEMLYTGASHRIKVIIGFSVDAFSKAWDGL